MLLGRPTLIAQREERCARTVKVIDRLGGVAPCPQFELQLLLLLREQRDHA